MTQYILGYGLTNEHFRQFVDPLPNNGDSEKDKTEDFRGKLKYEGYFIENLYFEIPTPSTVYDFMEKLFELDYIYSLRREYRRQKDYPEFETSLYDKDTHDAENSYVEEKLKDYKLTREIPEYLKELSIGFINTDSDTNVTFSIGINIDSLTEWEDKVAIFSSYADNLVEFFFVQEEHACPCIYKVR